MKPSERDPNWRRRPRFWTNRRLEELANLIDHGWSDVEIGAHFGKSAASIQLARKRHGIRPRSGYHLSARAVAVMLGIPCAKTVIRWIKRGYLRGRRGQQWGPYRQWYVGRGALLDFLADPAYWHLWEPERIPDTALRYHYRAMRGERYLTHVEVAARYCVQPATVGAWLDRGLLPAVRRGNRLIPESALVGFVPPGQRSRAGYRLRRFSASERDLILRMHAQGWTFQQIAEATSRTIGSVANAVYRSDRARSEAAS